MRWQPRERERERERERNSRSNLKISTNSSQNLANLNPTKTNSTNSSPILLAQNEIQTPNSDIKSYELEETTVVGRADSELNKYQSGASVNRQRLDSNPNTNGDIGSALKILPNVQFDNGHSISNIPGEIRPADISISGGLYYQNNFQLDGFNMNNDLNPTDNWDPHFESMVGSHSQGLNVDTSLLESIVVLDSNIGAAYGGFTSGVVEANVRKPRRDRWHFDLSYQYTSDKITKQHIDESLFEDDGTNFNFLRSSYEGAQANFTKQAVRFNFEGYATEKLGLIGGFSVVHSKIPLYAYESAIEAEKDTKRIQTRRSDNYFLKANYDFSDKFTLEANVAYMPSANKYFWAAGPDSFYTNKEGGWQAGLKGIWDTDLGLWTNQFGFSSLQNSREADANYYIWWHRSADYNYVSYDTQQEVGGPASRKELQRTYSYKSDMTFKPVQAFVEHKFRVGLELNYQNLRKNLIKDYYRTSPGRWDSLASVADLNGETCDYTYDFLDIPLCSSATTIKNSWNGQYVKNLFVARVDAPENKAKFDVFSYSIYAEDDMKIFDSGAGSLNARLGVRFDGDNYMDKSSLAPRFSLAYITPVKPEWQTQVTLGANRYYARNLFYYKLADTGMNFTKRLDRTNINSPWVEVDRAVTVSENFKKLKIPYSDELMVGLSQEIGIVNLNAKYINRQGKDEIMNSSQGYTNKGSSTSNILSISVQNTMPIKTFNIFHYYSLAFDWTRVKRAYNFYFSSDDDYINNPDILYDGKVIKYRDKPTENYARPWTLRLNTTHNWQFKQINFLWNNFFRYQDGYERMMTLNARSPGYDTAVGSTMTQYGKYKFKGAFSWDMRVGLDFRVDTLLRKETEAGRIYMNVDIINVLNSKNIIALGNSSLLGRVNTATRRYNQAVPAYEIGRQFWLQVGYKY